MRLLTARKTRKQRVRKRTSRAIYNSWKRPYRESLCHPNPKWRRPPGQASVSSAGGPDTSEGIAHQWETDDQCRCKWGPITPSVPWYTLDWELLQRIQTWNQRSKGSPAPQTVCMLMPNRDAGFQKQWWDDNLPNLPCIMSESGRSWKDTPRFLPEA